MSIIYEQMELDENRVYNKETFKKYLKSLGLYCSTPYLLGLESSGVIPDPRITKGMHNFGSKFRGFTVHEMRVLAAKIMKARTSDAAGDIVIMPYKKD